MPVPVLVLECAGRLPELDFPRQVMISNQYEDVLAKSFQVGYTMIIAPPKKMLKSNILLRS